jgi:hypothetical protein
LYKSGRLGNGLMGMLPHVRSDLGSSHMIHQFEALIMKNTVRDIE